MRALQSCLAVFLLAAGAIPAQPRCSARIIEGPVKVRPYGALPSSSASLVCARNEICSFQVVVTASGEDCPGVDVDVSGFARGASRIPAANVIIYREEFLNIFYRSNVEGDFGEWPDPLIPKVDPEYGERRNAFPYDLRRISRAYKWYPAEKGRTLSLPRSDGDAVAGGHYSGGTPKRYVVRIVRPGPLGTATFEWWSEPGPATPSAARTTSRKPAALEQGVSVAFRGAGLGNDFLAGDEFWIFAGPQRHQPVWVDVQVPADAAPGTYAGQVRVKAGGAALRLPLSIEVLNFAIPSTFTLASFFGFTSSGVAAAHFGGKASEQQSLELMQSYARAALRNSITIDGLRDFAPAYEFKPDGSIARTDYSRLDRAAAAFMDGQGTPRGARWTSLRLPKFAGLNDAQFASVVKDFAKHARERGWFDRLFDYSFDEPHSLQDFEQLRVRGRRVRDAEPQIPRLATTQLNDALFGIVTRWCPLVNSFATPSDFPVQSWLWGKMQPRADYNARLKAGDTLWWYQSCMSHGCGGEGRAAQDTGWPSTMVDASGAANRVFGLLSAVTYDVSGVLYWDTVFALHYNWDKTPRPADPWESIYYFGGNGDGTLFYPGRPEQIGGQHHIAIESLRLKMIRDSFIDAEYAYLLRKLGQEEFLRQEVKRVAQDARHWSADPQAWVALRRTLARRIAEKSPPADSPR